MTKRKQKYKHIQEFSIVLFREGEEAAIDEGFETSGHRAIYFPGQSIAGCVRLQLTKKLSFSCIWISLVGEASVAWDDTSDQELQDVQVSANQTYVSERHILKTGHTSGFLSVGSHSLPFQFTLPLDVPTSFQGTFGSITFRLKATIVRDSRQLIMKAADCSCEKLLSVLASYDLNADADAASSFALVENQCSMQVNSGTGCGFGYGSGVVSVLVHLQQHGFVPGQTILVDADINNHSQRSIHKINFKLLQTVSYYGVYRNRADSISTSYVKAKTTVEGIPPNKAMMLRSQPLPVPPVAPMSVNRPEGGIIRVLYHVLVEVDIEAATNYLRVLLPVTIGTVPIVDELPPFALVQQLRHAPLPLLHQLLYPNLEWPQFVSEENSSEDEKLVSNLYPFYEETKQSPPTFKLITALYCM